MSWLRGWRSRVLAPGGGPVRMFRCEVGARGLVPCVFPVWVLGVAGALIGGLCGWTRERQKEGVTVCVEGQKW